jgi:phage-related baseplate assembly protein
MTDPGHPFAVPFADVVTALEDRVREGVEQPAVVSFVVTASTPSFELPSGTDTVVRVAGTRRGVYQVFTPDVDYRVLGNRLVWTGEQPDAGSRLDVDYTYRERPAGLTDFNQGSVVSTLLRAVAYEFTALYAQLDEAYRRAFIDQANGVGLENVVALLGIRRKAPLAATGSVTFSRRRATGTAVPVPSGTRVADRAGRTFATTVPASIPAAGLTVTVLVEALVAGPDGNVAPGTIVVMPTPPSGVDGVTNSAPLTGGTDAEPDDQLRERAKHALERVGNATLDAIRFSVLGIDGVSGATVTDRGGDDSVPLGEVWVRWAGEDDADVAAQVEQAVENTRAAGVVARTMRISEVFVSGALYAIGEPQAPDTAAAVLRDRVVASLAALDIGEPLSSRRLASFAYDVPGLAEVAETALTYRRPDGSTGPVGDTFLVGPTDVVRPGEVTVVLLGALAVTAARPDQLTIAIRSRAGTTAPLTAFAFDTAITFSAVPANTPDRPPVPVGRIVRRVTFPAGTIPVRPDDYDLDGYLPRLTVTVTAAAYPGLDAATTTIDVPGGG